jgi:catechol 2,3-dioxygenase-like lactoylglutathione lyase family enzyme
LLTVPDMEAGRDAARATTFNHVSIYAKSLEGSVAFYSDLFGMGRIPSPVFRLPTAWLRVGDQELHLVVYDAPAPRLQHFALAVADFEAVCLKAKALGILDPDTWSAPMYELPDGSVQMYLPAPADNLVEVDWPDATTLNRSVVTGLRKLADDVPQNTDAGHVTLFPAG